MGKDVLDDRYRGLYTLEAIANADPNNVFVTEMARMLAQHVIDLKSEVVRLRAQKVELTKTQRGIIDAYQAHVMGADNVHWLRCALKYTVDIINGLCPPKAPPSDAELLDMLERINLSDPPLSSEAKAVSYVRNALRARGGK